MAAPGARDVSRDALLGRFRESGGAILLGTASFWEGVDVPGDALPRAAHREAPLSRPTEPITARPVRSDRGVWRRLVPRIHAPARFASA
jgi:Rad3-related DNA helicase